MLKFDLSKFSFWILLSGVSLALILVIAVGLAGPAAPNGETDVAPGLSREVIKARYYHDIKVLMSDYLSELGELDELESGDEYLEATRQAKAQALEYFVPEEAKALHLDIVVALNFLEKGFSGSEEDLGEGVAMMKEIIENNSWLAE